ncbi:MAG TPA: hypothetical protein VJN63_06335, partial [Thermoplasmata archaeon]|nr:hypothetical protein [Thermoplasmata archaeon]
AAFNVSGGTVTQVGTTTTVATVTPLWVRLTRATNTFTFFRSSDGSAWTQDEQFTRGDAPSAFFVSFVELFSGTGPSQVSFDDYQLVAGSLTGIETYKRSGSWTSPAQTTGGEYPHRISIVASSLSATSYVDGIDILDAAGNIVYSDATNFNAGTTMDYGVPYSEAVANAWSVRVNLAGDGSGTPAVESISVTTDPNPVTGGIGKRGVHVDCTITWPIQYLECVGWVDQWWKDLAGGLKESWFVVNGRVVLQNGTLKMPAADSWYIPELVSYEVVFIARSHFGISAPSLPETVTLEKRSLGFIPVLLTLLAMIAVARFTVVKQHGKPEETK